MAENSFNLWNIIGLFGVILGIIALGISIYLLLRKQVEYIDPCENIVCADGVCENGICKCIPQQDCYGVSGFQMDKCGNRFYCGPCVPKTANEVCGASECGTKDDGCGGTINCGNCNQFTNSFCDPLTEKCDCSPTSQGVACGTRECGNRSDGCGSNYSCGPSEGACTHKPFSTCNGSGRCVCISGYQEDASGNCVSIPKYNIYYGAAFIPSDPTFQDIPNETEITTSGMTEQSVVSPPSSVTINNIDSQTNIPFYAVPSRFATDINFLLSGLRQSPTKGNPLTIGGENYVAFQIGGALAAGGSLVLSDINYLSPENDIVLDNNDREYSGSTVNITGPISTGGSTQSNIPSYDSNDGVGGYKVVPTLVDMTLIYQNLRRVGMMVRVLENDVIYVLQSGGESVGPLSLGQRNAFISNPSTNTDDGSTFWEPFTLATSVNDKLICTDTSCILSVPLIVEGNITNYTNDIITSDVVLQN